MMRQVVLDTETTGLEVGQDHRIIEIGCVEIVNRRITGKLFQRYLDPERDIDEGAQAVHGLSREQLRHEKKFTEILPELRAFIDGAELIIHNAAFDVAFLDAEFARAGSGAPRVEQICRVLDTLSLARRMHPGQRNSLDALCKRYAVDNSHRDLHGALLDARILAEVYLAMTGGQAHLTLGVRAGDERADGAATDATAAGHAPRRIAVVHADAAELAAHEHILELLDKASNGATVWRKT